MKPNETPAERAERLRYMREYNQARRKERHEHKAATSAPRHCIDCGGWLDPLTRSDIMRCPKCIAKRKNEARERSRKWQKEHVEDVKWRPVIEEPTETACRLCGGEWKGPGHYCEACRTTRRSEVMDDIDKRNGGRWVA